MLISYQSPHYLCLLAIGVKSVTLLVMMLSSFVIVSKFNSLTRRLIISLNKTFQLTLIQSVYMKRVPTTVFMHPSSLLPPVVMYLSILPNTFLFQKQLKTKQGTRFHVLLTFERQLYFQLFLLLGQLCRRFTMDFFLFEHRKTPYRKDAVIGTNDILTVIFSLIQSKWSSGLWVSPFFLHSRLSVKW